MEHIVLRTNAIPVYGFLSMITARRERGDALPGSRILDCGAGGPVPPLALFQQHGFECWGIDASETQLARGREFSEEQDIDLLLHHGDMRQIPFGDDTFDYVYEQYSMCHLCKRDTARAVAEMHRVLKRGGLCFLGVISADTWPRSLFGREEEPGEYWGEEDGDERRLHSMFTTQEAEALVSAFDIVWQEMQVRYLRQAAEETTLDEWMALYEGTPEGPQHEAWRGRYETRATAFRYAHMYYVLRKL